MHARVVGDASLGVHTWSSSQHGHTCHGFMVQLHQLLVLEHRSEREHFQRVRLSLTLDLLPFHAVGLTLRCRSTPWTRIDLLTWEARGRSFPLRALLEHVPQRHVELPPGPKAETEGFLAVHDPCPSFLCGIGVVLRVLRRDHPLRRAVLPEPPSHLSPIHFPFSSHYRRGRPFVAPPLSVPERFPFAFPFVGTFHPIRSLSSFL